MFKTNHGSHTSKYAIIIKKSRRAQYSIIHHMFINHRKHKHPMDPHYLTSKKIQLGERFKMKDV